MKAHEELHKYLRDSCRDDMGGEIKEAFRLSLDAEKNHLAQEAEIVNLKEKIASQANMIDKLQVKAGHVDLLRDLLGDVMGEYQCVESVIVQTLGEDYQSDYNELSDRFEKALEQTKES